MRSPEARSLSPAPLHPKQSRKHTPRLGRGAQTGFQPRSRWAVPAPPAPTPGPGRPRGTRALRKPGRQASRDARTCARSPARRSAPTASSCAPVRLSGACERQREMKKTQGTEILLGGGRLGTLSTIKGKKTC